MACTSYLPMYIIPAIRHQAEIMSAHWSSDGVTIIFTVVVYYRSTEDGPLEHLSYAIVSDNLNHDKKAVYANNSLLMSELKQAMPWPITMVHYWSDGAVSQLKNRYNFLNVAFHQRDFECDADWSFFLHRARKGSSRRSRR